MSFCRRNANALAKTTQPESVLRQHIFHLVSYSSLLPYVKLAKTSILPLYQRWNRSLAYDLLKIRYVLMFYDIFKLFLMSIYALTSVRDYSEEMAEFPARGSKGAKPWLQTPKVLIFGNCSKIVITNPTVVICQGRVSMLLLGHAETSD